MEITLPHCWRRILWWDIKPVVTEATGNYDRERGGGRKGETVHGGCSRWRPQSSLSPSAAAAAAAADCIEERGERNDVTGESKPYPQHIPLQPASCCSRRQTSCQEVGGTRTGKRNRFVHDLLTQTTGTTPRYCINTKQVRKLKKHEFNISVVVHNTPRS